MPRANVTSGSVLGMPATRLALDRIRDARKVIDPVFVDTPAYVCEPLGLRLGCEVTIKLETANPVRSFKGRGSEVVMDGIASGNGSGAVCASAGNLGQALAYSGRRRQLPVTVVAAKSANAGKLDRIRELGAELVLVDGDIENARAEAFSIAEGRGIRLVEDSLDIETCEGAATIGLELVEPSRDLAGLIVEPSAALGVAALLENPARFAGGRIATIICGSNVDLNDFARWTGTGAAPASAE